MKISISDLIDTAICRQCYRKHKIPANKNPCDDVGYTIAVTFCGDSKPPKLPRNLMPYLLLTCTILTFSKNYSNFLFLCVCYCNFWRSISLMNKFIQILDINFVWTTLVYIKSYIFLFNVCSKLYKKLYALNFHR